MVADTLPITLRTLRDQRRALLLWGIAVAAISGMYIALYPTMGATGEMEALIENMPEAMVTAFGYDQIGTAGGWMTSTVYGLIGPVLLLVFAVGNGARLAGQEEDGSLELELTAPVERQRLLAERLAALVIGIAVLVGVVAAVTFALNAAQDQGVPAVNVWAGVAGLFLLVVGFATLALAAGAITGRRSIALAVGGGVAVVAFVFDALGPTVEADWMTAVSPFSWYLGENPLLDGFDVGGLLLLAVVPVVAATAAFVVFSRRDLMV